MSGAPDPAFGILQMGSRTGYLAPNRVEPRVDPVPMRMHETGFLFTCNGQSTVWAQSIIRGMYQMESIRVSLPDGSVIEVPRATTIRDLAARLSPRLAARAILGLVDGVAHDLAYPITADAAVTIVDETSPEGLDAMRHTAAHVMAQAVLRVFPGTKLAIGPTIADGFYYDFDKDGSFSPDDLARIEAEMSKIVKEDLPVEREELPVAEALKRLGDAGEVYKTELLEDLAAQGEQTVSFYRQGEFVDLCRGPHLPRTGMLRAFKLLNVAGAYWRGDEARPMLSRIYGTAFASKSKLDEHIRLMEEAARRDHRKLGKELTCSAYTKRLAPG